MLLLSLLKYSELALSPIVPNFMFAILWSIFPRSLFSLLIQLSSLHMGVEAGHIPGRE
jgi:hypothetical protein